MMKKSTVFLIGVLVFLCLFNIVLLVLTQNPKHLLLAALTGILAIVVRVKNK